MATGAQEEIEEELRLAYVAMTRARDFLYMLWPLRYYHKVAGLSDRHSYAQMSPFLTPEVLATMEQVKVRKDGGSNAVIDGNGARRDIGSRLREMWK